MIKRTFSVPFQYVITLSTLFLVVLTACGMPFGGSSRGQPVTITFAAWEYEHPLYQPLAEAFMAEHPEITLVVLPMEDLLLADDITASSSQTTMLRHIVSGADTAPALSTWATPDIFESGLLLNLQPLMDADSSFQRDDFYPGTLEYYTTETGTWILPRTFYVQIMAYNKGLFKAAGVPMPEPGWTWDDVLHAAEQIASQSNTSGDSDRVYGYVDPSNGYLTFYGILQSAGIDMLTTPTEAVQLDTDGMVAAVERMQALVESGAIYHNQLVAAPEVAITPDYNQAIQDGRVGIWDNQFGQSPMGVADPGQADAPPVQVGKVPYPAMETSLISGGDGYIISSGTQHPQEAWMWIEFLSRHSLDMGSAGMPDIFASSMIPARQALADDTGFWDGVDDETATAYRWALEHLLPPSDASADTILPTIIVQAIDTVITGEQEPYDALRQAQEQLESRLVMARLAPDEKEQTDRVVVATPEPVAAPAGSTSITFISTENSATEMRQLARDFRENHPDIFIEIMPASTFEGEMDLATLAQTNDCFATTAAIQSDEEAALLYDIQPMLDTSSVFPPTDISPVLLDHYRRDGALLGLPYGYDMRTLTYNQTAFDEAGIDVPLAAWTPDDFLAAAQALTSGTGDNKTYGYVPLGVPIEDLFFFIRQFGGAPFTGTGDALRPDFTNPAVVEAIQWYIDLDKVHTVTPPLAFPHKPGDPFEDTSFDLIQQGRAGMWFDYGYGMFRAAGSMGADDLTMERDFEVKIAPLPVGKAGLSRSDLVYTSGFFISAEADHPEVCWQWMLYLSETAPFMRRGIPARSSIAGSVQFLEQAPPGTAELVSVYRQALEATENTGQPQLPLYEYTEMYWLFEAIEQALDEDADLTTVLREAQQTTTAYLECLANQGTPGGCARQVDSSYDGYVQ